MNKTYRLLKTWRVALAVLLGHKKRSLMAMLGVGIGVGAVIAMLAIGEGSQRSIMATIEGMGTNLVIISAAKAPTALRQMSAGAVVTTLIKGDAIAIEQEVPFTKYIAPAHVKKATIKFGGESALTTVLGATPNIRLIRNYEVSTGQFYDDDDENGSRRVVVLGHTVAKILFSDGGGIGETVRINGVQFVVIGFLREKGPDINGQDQDDVIVTPLSSAMKKMFNASYLTNIYVQASSGAVMDQAVGAIQAVLGERHRVSPQNNPDFTVLNQAELLRTKQEVQNTLTVLLASLAGISLLIGGIGILSVMLLSVRERTWEIGLRRALGANRTDIRNQFVMEAAFLSAIGGAGGILLGIISALAVNLKAGWPLAFNVLPIIMTFSYALVVGILFGLYPAVKASRLNPIDALRSK